MLYTFHQYSPNDFSEIFSTPEVASLFENHAHLLVLDVFQDNRIILWDSGSQMLFSVAFPVSWWMFQSELQLVYISLWFSPVPCFFPVPQHPLFRTWFHSHGWLWHLSVWHPGWTISLGPVVNKGRQALVEWALLKIIWCWFRIG